MTWIWAIFMLAVGVITGYVVAAVLILDMPKRERKRKNV